MAHGQRLYTCSADSGYRLATEGPLAAANHSKKREVFLFLFDSAPFFYAPCVRELLYRCKSGSCLRGLKLAKPLDLTPIFLFSEILRRVIWYSTLFTASELTYPDGGSSGLLLTVYTLLPD